MSVLSVKNLQEVFIAKSISRTSSVQITDPSATSTYIADGEVVVLNSSGAVATSSDTVGSSPYMQIVQRSGNEVRFSPRIFGNKVTNWKGTSAGSSSTNKEQIYEIGYTGAGSATLDVTTGYDYMVSLTFNHDWAVYSEQKQQYTLFATSSFNTQRTLAVELSRQGMVAYNQNSIPVTVAMLNSGTGTADGTNTIAVVHGSSVVVTATALTIGGIYRIGVTGSAVGITLPVYTVKAAHSSISNGYVLDQCYAGPSNAALAATAWGSVVEGASWGLRITGKALPFVKDFFKFNKVTFNIGLTGFGATVINKKQEAVTGAGDGRVVSEEESFCKGFEGALNRMTIPLPTAQVDADFVTVSAVNTTLGDSYSYANTYYDCSTIQFDSVSGSSVIQANTKFPNTIKIFSVDGAAQIITGTSSVNTVLNAWLATTADAWATVTL